MSSLLVLPDCVLVHVLSFLGHTELATVARVDKRLHGLCGDNLLWRGVFDRAFPYPPSRPGVVHPAVFGTNNLPLAEAHSYDWRESFRRHLRRRRAWEGGGGVPLVPRTLVATPHRPVEEDVSFMRVCERRHWVYTLSSRGSVRVWDLNVLTNSNESGLLLTVIPPMEPHNPDTPSRLDVCGPTLAVGTQGGAVHVFSVDDDPPKATLVHVLVDGCRPPPVVLHQHEQSEEYVWGVWVEDERTVLVCHGVATLRRWSVETGHIIGSYLLVLESAPQDDLYFLLRNLSVVPLARRGLDDDGNNNNNRDDGEGNGEKEGGEGRDAPAKRPDAVLALVTSHASGEIHAWDIGTGAHLQTYRGHEDTCSRLGFRNDHPDELISSSYDETIRVWDLHTAQCLRSLRAPDLVSGMCPSKFGGPLVAVVMVQAPRTGRQLSAGVGVVDVDAMKLVRVVRSEVLVADQSNSSCWFNGLVVVYTCGSALYDGQLRFVCAE